MKKLFTMVLMVLILFGVVCVSIGVGIRVADLRSNPYAVTWTAPNEPPTPPEPEPILISFIDIVQESIKGVVHIQCPQWQCSGFVVGPNLIVTARHGVEGVKDFEITTYDEHKLHATRAISDKEHDVAFIWIDDLTCTAEERGTVEHDVILHPLPLGNITDCVLGQDVYVIGSPHGKVNFNSLTTGIISGVNRDWSKFGANYGWEIAFTTDSAGHPGNSGCPVFTRDGFVRGILVGGFSPVLISVMPCDLFIDDLETIGLMFAQDRYYREIENEITTEDLLFHINGVEYQLTNSFESLLELVGTLRDRIIELEDQLIWEYAPGCYY